MCSKAVTCKSFRDAEKRVFLLYFCSGQDPIGLGTLRGLGFYQNSTNLGHQYKNKPKETHAIHHCRNFIHFMAAGSNHVLHFGRIHSSPPGGGDHCRCGAINLRQEWAAASGCLKPKMVRSPSAQPVAASTSLNPDVWGMVSARSGLNHRFRTSLTDRKSVV